MSTFTIDPDNNITALIEVLADVGRSTTFSSEKELAKLVGERPISRLIEAWNSFAGVARIRAAIQRLSPMDAQPARDVAAANSNSKKSATKRRGANVRAQPRTNGATRKPRSSR